MLRAVYIQETQEDPNLPALTASEIWHKHEMKTKAELSTDWLGFEGMPQHTYSIYANVRKIISFKISFYTWTVH